MEAILIIILLIILFYVYGFMIALFLFLLGAGCLVALPVGIFLGIKNYMSSIRENIDNKALKNSMMIITPMIIIIFLLCIFIR